jgi:hypothetical protein
LCPVSPSELYAHDVFSFSRKTPEDSFYSGLHYARLGRFLISPYRSNGDSTSAIVSSTNANFATLYDLDYQNCGNDRIRQFINPDEFAAHMEPSKQSRNGSAGRILFIRGFPSPQWLNQIGATFDVDPEFFYRHIEISADSTSSTATPDYYCAPHLPSSADIIQLRISNIGSWDNSRSLGSIETLRKDCSASMNLHLEDFLRLRNMSVCDSIVRRFTVHDIQHFTVEQMISIKVLRHDRRWTGDSNLLDGLIDYAANSRQSQYSYG